MFWEHKLCPAITLKHDHRCFSLVSGYRCILFNNVSVFIDMAWEEFNILNLLFQYAPENAVDEVNLEKKNGC